MIQKLAYPSEEEKSAILIYLIGESATNSAELERSIGVFMMCQYRYLVHSTHAMTVYCCGNGNTIGKHMKY